MTRHELRYKIMTILYQANLYEKNNIEFDIDKIISSQLKESNNFVEDTVRGVRSHMDLIDKVANMYLTDWDIERLGYTDQAILRMGIYEIMYTDTPPVACINEAVELAKKYSDIKVCKMINGVLDKVYHCGENNGK